MEAKEMEENGLLEWYGAEKSWERARRKDMLQKSICAVKRCSPDLLVFEQVAKTGRLSHKVYRGIQEIRLDDIRGSVGRAQDFSMNFLPRWRHMRQRWETVNTVMLMQGMLPIKVYKVNDVYFVLDGHHRTSVARQLELCCIEAHIWEYTT